MNINQVTIVGRMVRDPELKALPNGNAVVNFSVATSRTWKGTDGQKKEETEFHNCVAFQRTAEVIGQYLKKGQLVGITGRLQTRSWDDKDSGKKVYKTEIFVDQMQMGPKAGNGGGAQATASTEDQGNNTGEKTIDPNDIPF